MEKLGTLYVSNRQWGNVREDYSPNGNARNFTNHNNAESYAYRWGEEGIAGISDIKQLLCFAFFILEQERQNGKGTILWVEQSSGKSWEDIKEIFYYLDNTPTHSYMKMVYKYPINEFPYDELVAEKRKTQ